MANSTKFPRKALFDSLFRMSLYVLALLIQFNLFLLLWRHPDAPPLDYLVPFAVAIILCFEADKAEK